MAGQAVWHINDLEISIRISISILVGGLVGLERERGQHHAGFRTHILVCLGSTLITLISIYGFSQFANEPNVRMDPGRISAQIISGIGFLGAGTIMRNGNAISGLTTAASLWVVAAMGIAVGAGFYYGAFLTLIGVLISLLVLPILEKRLLAFARTEAYTVTLEKEGNPGIFLDFFRDEGVRVKSLKMNVLEEGTVQLHFILSNKKSEWKHKLSMLAIRADSHVRQTEIKM